MNTQIQDDIEFVKIIIPDNYTVTEDAKKGSIRCEGGRNTGFKNAAGDTDQEAFDEFHAKLKAHFGDRFQETYCHTCTWYQDFVIYLKS